MRGDVYLVEKVQRIQEAFSPHARGCSDTIVRELGFRRVFPACAGMFRFTKVTWPARYSFPRMRGDVPIP